MDVMVILRLETVNILHLGAITVVRTHNSVFPWPWMISRVWSAATLICVALRAPGSLRQLRHDKGGGSVTDNPECNVCWPGHPDNLITNHPSNDLTASSAGVLRVWDVVSIDWDHPDTGGRDTGGSRVPRIPHSQLWRNARSPEYKQDKHTIFRFYDGVFIFNWEIPNHISKGVCRNQNHLMFLTTCFWSNFMIHMLEIFKRKISQEVFNSFWAWKILLSGVFCQRYRNLNSRESIKRSFISGNCSGGWQRSSGSD